MVELLVYVVFGYLGFASQGIFFLNAMEVQVLMSVAMLFFAFAFYHRSDTK